MDRKIEPTKRRRRVGMGGKVAGVERDLEME